VLLLLLLVVVVVVVWPCGVYSRGEQGAWQTLVVFLKGDVLSTQPCLCGGGGLHQHGEDDDDGFETVPLGTHTHAGVVERNRITCRP